MECAWSRVGGLEVSGGRLAVTYEARLTQTSGGAEDALGTGPNPKKLTTKCRQKRSGSAVRTV